MIKKMAWNTFKNTGDVNTFLELKQIQNIEAQIHGINPMMHQNADTQMSQNIQQQMEAQNGNNQNEWYNNF